MENHFENKEKTPDTEEELINCDHTKKEFFIGLAIFISPFILNDIEILLFSGMEEARTTVTIVGVSCLVISGFLMYPYEQCLKRRKRQRKRLEEQNKKPYVNILRDPKEKKMDKVSF